MGVKAVMSYSAVEWCAMTGSESRIREAANTKRNMNRFVFTAIPPGMLDFSNSQPCRENICPAFVSVNFIS
jgi:hypothetical protein